MQLMFNRCISGLHWWSRVHLPMQGTQVRSLVWELSSHIDVVIQLLSCVQLHPMGQLSQHDTTSELEL